MRILYIRTQRGYFLFLAVVFIFVIGLMGTLIAYLFSTQAMLSVNQQNGLKVFYNAESGLDIATHYLERNSISTSPIRISCASVTGTAQLTNASLNGGTFTVTTRNSSPIYATTTLNGALTSSTTTVNIISTTGFASTGRVIVDNEAIDYASISGNSFVGVTRGAGGTLASSHASGAGVGQYQCALDVQAGIPSIASPTYQRELQWNVQLQDGYAVGVNNGNNDTIINWNQITELAWSDNSYVAGSTYRNSLNAISMLSNADGWAVGDEANSSLIFLHWTGSAWSLNAISGACNGQHLQGVSMVSSAQGFAVGARYRPACAGSGNFRYTILKWDGSSWSLLTPVTSPSIPADSSSLQNLNAVHVIDTNGDGLANIGFAVGNTGTILKYNGTNWVVDTSPTTKDLFGVYTVSASEAWAVGASGTILKWNGSTWSAYTSPVTNQLNAIAMYDSNGDGVAEFGVIAGNSARALTYNGSTWSSTDVGSNNLFAAGVYNSNDAWVGGASGALYQWDGSSWTSVASPTSKAINGMSLVRQSSPPTSLWRQIFY